MSEPVALQPRGLQYYLLLLAAWLLRLPALYAARAALRKALQSLPPGVSRTRIQVPSRDKDRSITVDVYEKVSEQESGKKRVHLNFHG